MNEGKCVSQLLNLLDENAGTYDFPILNNAYSDYALGRMSTYRSSIEWIIVFQVSEYYPKTPEFGTYIYAFGNMLATQGVQDMSRVPSIVTAAPGHAIFGEDGHFLLDPLDFSVRIRGKDHAFRLSLDDYKRARIDISSGMSDPAKIIRYLAHVLPCHLFYSDYELLSACGADGPGLRKILELNDWEHPDIANDEKPSDTETFRQIAHATCAGSPHLFTLLGKGNVDWHNWLHD